MPTYDRHNSYLHQTQWQWINSPANTNLHSAWWDRSPLLKKRILWAPLLWFYYDVSLFFFCPLTFSTSSPLHLSPSSLTLLFFSPSALSSFLACKIVIFSNPLPFAKTVTFRSFSNLELNCANNSLRQLEPYMVLSLVLDAGNIRTLASYFTLLTAQLAIQDM